MKNNKEEIKKEMFNKINYFYETYSLPEQRITDDEWNSLLNVVEAHFLVHGIMNDYSNALNIIVIRAMNYSYIDGDSFNINHIEKALDDLVAFKIPKDEIDAMKEELNSKVKKINR